MSPGERFEVGGTMMRVVSVESGRLRFSPVSDPDSAPPRFTVSGGNMARIVAAHAKRKRRAMRDHVVVVETWWGSHNFQGGR